MTSVGTRLTAEEFAKLPDDPGRGKLELVDGEVVVSPPVGEEHGWIGQRLSRRLATQVEDAGHGLVLVESGYVLKRAPDMVREPDVSIRYHASPGEITSGFREGHPDVAVEIVSPSDSAVDVATKVHEYLQAGSRRVWVVWPQRRAVTIHRPDGTSITRESDAVLTTDDLGFEVPDFQLPIADIFPPRT